MKCNVLADVIPEYDSNSIAQYGIQATLPKPQGKTSKTEMAVTNYLCSIRRGKILEFKSAIERIINTSSRKEREFIQEYYFNKRL